MATYSLFFHHVILVFAIFTLGIMPFRSMALKVGSLPPNMYADTAFAPFLHGVASGDPLPQQVIIWTRITPDSFQTSPKSVVYEVSPNQSFSQIKASGTFTTDSMRDWTVKVELTGLNPDTRYYYRFISPSLDTSRIGRTRTAPTDNVDHLRFGVVSCASVFSGYFTPIGGLANGIAYMRSFILAITCTTLWMRTRKYAYLPLIQ